MTRVELLQVCLLELHDCVFCMVGIFCGRNFEIFLDSLPCLIFRFLLGDPVVSRVISTQTKGSSFTFNLERGLITSLSRMSTKSCWVLASTSVVRRVRPQARVESVNAYLFSDCLSLHPRLRSSWLVRHEDQMRRQQLLPFDGVSVRNRYFERKKSTQIPVAYRRHDERQLTKMPQCFA